MPKLLVYQLNIEDVPLWSPEAWVALSLAFGVCGALFALTDTLKNDFEVHNNDYIASTRNSGTSAYFNRRTDDGDIAEFRFKGRTFVLLKPSTYMNRSGKAVRYWLQKKKIQKSNLLVVLDDLNLPFGKQRLKGKGSDGGHNGLKDIDQLTGGNNYA